MSWLYRAVRPVLFSLPAETAHRVTRAVGEQLQDTPLQSVLARQYAVDDDRLVVEPFGLEFANPIGVAAGFDKNGRLVDLLAALGFGHVEIGGVTARPQEGNPRPRMFRLPEDRALINRMGFNNEGADRVADRLDDRPQPPVPLGVNLGQSKGVPPAHAPSDYRYSYERLREAGDFFVINVSSPNTPGLRELQARESLIAIVETLQDAGASPLLVKVSPDLSDDAIREVCGVVEERQLDGVIATNTTVERGDLVSPKAAEPGGLSGRPLADRSTHVIRTVAGETDVPIVGVGGVATAEDAYRKIRAGASLVQLYTALVYEGPTVARDINQGLLDLLAADGYESVEAAVGADVD